MLEVWGVKEIGWQSLEDGVEGGNGVGGEEAEEGEAEKWWAVL